MGAEVSIGRHPCECGENEILCSSAAAEKIELPGDEQCESSLASTYSGGDRSSEVSELEDEVLALEEASLEADEDWRMPIDDASTADQSQSEVSSLSGSEKYQDAGRVVTLMSLAQRRRRQGDVDGSLQTIEMALVTLKSTSSSGLRCRLALLNSKGVALSGLNQTSPALKEYSKALQLCKCLGLLGRVPEAVLQMNIGMAYMQLQDSTRATQHFAKALKIRETQKAMDSVGGVLLLERIADIKTERGDLDGAFDAYTSALGRWQSMDTAERLEGARVLSKLGTIDRMQRHYLGALQKYAHATSILMRAKATSGSAFANVQGDIGIVRRELGELVLARQAFEKALAIRKESDSLHTFTGVLLLMNYGTTLRMLDDQQGALEQYSKARRIRKKLGAPTGSADYHLLVQMSLAAQELEERPWALESFLEAQRIRRQLGMAQTAEGERALKSIGTILLVPCSSEDSSLDLKAKAKYAQQLQELQAMISQMREEEKDVTTPLSDISC